MLMLSEYCDGFRISDNVRLVFIYPCRQNRAERIMLYRRVKIAQKWAKRDEKYYQADFFTIDSSYAIK